MDKKKIDMMEQYISGALNQNEIDNLWAEFIRDPELFGYFETLLHLHHILRDPAGSFRESLPK